MCKKVRQIFSVAHYQYIEWLLSGKQIVVLIILFFLMQYVSKPLDALSEKTNIPFQWTEIFLATVNSVYFIPIILFCFITLMSEFPKRSYEDLNILFRTKRANWYYGQVLFGIYAVITFIAEMAGLFLLRTISFTYLDNGWSPIIKNYMERYLEEGKRCGVVAVVSSEVYNHFSPNEAFFYNVLLLFGMFLEINFILMLFNLLNRKATGVVTIVLMTILGVGMIYMKSDYLMLFPIGNAMPKCHNLPVTKLTEWYEPVLYFFVSNGVLVIVGKLIIKRIQL